jgi:drug/metabolite transporter, DME family
MTVLRSQDASEPGFPIRAFYVLAAGLTWSFTGVFLRLAPDLDSWQFLAWRSLGVACAFALIMRSQGRGPLAPRFLATGRIGTIVAVALSVSSIAFIVAMKMTTVANALFTAGASPPMARAAK